MHERVRWAEPPQVSNLHDFVLVAPTEAALSASASRMHEFPFFWLARATGLLGE